MDLRYLVCDLASHIVDAGTKFFAAKFILITSTTNIWETFAMIWVKI